MYIKMLIIKENKKLLDLFVICWKLIDKYKLKIVILLLKLLKILGKTQQFSYIYIINWQ